MKVKHNKKRNTAFLYETLVRELTKASMNEDRKRKAAIVKMIRRSFHKGTALAADLSHYQTLLETSGVKAHIAERLVRETKKARAEIDAEQLFNEQSQLIAAMNKELGQDVFKTFVPNYKALASIYQIFAKEVPVKKRVFLEESIQARLVEDRAAAEDDMEPISTLAYKTFVSRFNEQYGSGLLEEQKELLSRYVVSFTDNSVGLKVYLNEELGRLKRSLRESMEIEEIKSDAEMTTKAKRVLDLLETYNKEPVGRAMVETVLKIQNLAEEVSKDVDQD